MYRICVMVIIMVLLGSSASLGAFNLTAAGAGVLAWIFVGFIALFVLSHIVPAFIQCIELLRCAFKHYLKAHNR